MKYNDLIANYKYVCNGKGKDTDINSVNKKELLIGYFVEKEHFPDANYRLSIAIDHITEASAKNKLYYKTLVESGLVDEPDALKAFNRFYAKN